MLYALKHPTERTDTMTTPLELRNLHLARAATLLDDGDDLLKQARNGNKTIEAPAVIALYAGASAHFAAAEATRHLTG